MQHANSTLKLRRQRNAIAPLLAALLIGLGTAPANAHAHLVSANPSENGNGPPPSEVSLLFSEPLERAFSAIIVKDASGKQVDKRDIRLDMASTLRVSLPPLPPGQYRVEWRAVSTDTHKIQGAYTFSVRP
jgi:copper resistance protein C